MSGTPEWLRSKCNPLGVMMPSRAAIGVRATPIPGVVGLAGGGDVRTTSFSKWDGWP